MRFGRVDIGDAHLLSGHPEGVTIDDAGDTGAICAQGEGGGERKKDKSNAEGTPAGSFRSIRINPYFFSILTESRSVFQAIGAAVALPPADRRRFHVQQPGAGMDPIGKHRRSFRRHEKREKASIRGQRD
jgi:hypothetical protein